MCEEHSSAAVPLEAKSVKRLADIVNRLKVTKHRSLQSLAARGICSICCRQPRKRITKSKWTHFAAGETSHWNYHFYYYLLLIFIK